MNEEIEKTNLLKTLFIETEEISIVEKIEEFEDKIDYLDIPDKEKEDIKMLCDKIKQEEDENTRAYLFNLLKSEVK